VPSTGTPSTSAGPVHPLGVRSTIMGQRGRAVSLSVRARCWTARISATTSSRVAAMAWCIAAGSDPVTNRGAYP